MPEDYHPEPHAPRRKWLPRSILAPGIAIGFVNVQYPVVTGFLILHLKSHGNSGPVAFSAYAGMILLSRFFLGGLARPHRAFHDVLRRARIHGRGVAGAGGGPGPVVAVGATAMLGFGFSFPWSSIASTVLRRTPSSERGSAVGILSAFYDLFVGVSSFAAGWVAHQLGYSAAFVMAALALVAAAIAGSFVFFTRAKGQDRGRSVPAKMAG